MNARSIVLVLLFAVPALAQQPLTPPPLPPTDVAPERAPEPPAAAPLADPPLLARATASAPARYRFSGTIPPGFHLVTQPRWPALIPGVALFAVGYGVMLATAINLHRAVWAIPLAGPLVLLGDLAGAFATPLGALLGGFVVVFAVADFVLQSGGLLLTIVGITGRTRWLERDERPRVTLVPGASGAPAGLTLVGRF